MYLPARFRPTRRYPLLVVHDGGDYIHYAALKEVLSDWRFRKASLEDGLIKTVHMPSNTFSNAEKAANRLNVWKTNPIR